MNNEKNNHSKNMQFKCSICSRITPEEFQEKHHLFPRKSRKSKKKNDIIILCCSCADILHQLFTNKELRQQYNSIENILSNDKIQKWIKWVSKKPKNFSICIAKKKRKERTDYHSITIAYLNCLSN